MTAVATPTRASRKDASESISQNGIVSIVALCVGISPMLQNPMTDATIQGLITGVHPQKDKSRALEDVARDRMYVGEGGAVGVPMMNLIAALKHAGRKVKNGRGAISTAKSTTLFSFAEFEGDFLPFLDQPETGGPRLIEKKGVIPKDELVWSVDVRRGVMANGPKPVAVGLVRPAFHNWRIRVNVTVNEQIVRNDTLKKMFDEAGTNAGLGDFRPQTGGPFGRFRVASWDVTPVVEQ